MPVLNNGNPMFISNYNPQRAVDRLALEIYSSDGRTSKAKAYAMVRLRLGVKKNKKDED